MKADLLRARDMKRYINQLTVAKKQCEKRIRLLGGPNYENSEEGGAEDADELQSQRVRRRRVSPERREKVAKLQVVFHEKPLSFSPPSDPPV